MKKAIKILAIYSILISLYSIVTNFLMIGSEITINSTIAVITLLTLAPVIIFSVLVILYLKRK